MLQLVTDVATLDDQPALPCGLEVECRILGHVRPRAGQRLLSRRQLAIGRRPVLQHAVQLPAHGLAALIHIFDVRRDEMAFTKLGRLRFRHHVDGLGRCHAIADFQRHQILLLAVGRDDPDIAIRIEQRVELGDRVLGGRR